MIHFGVWNTEDCLLTKATVKACDVVKGVVVSRDITRCDLDAEGGNRYYTRR